MSAIGVFDSGVGGLTVLRQIADTLPQEPLIYLGDTARVPYGTKSPETVLRYARACSRLLVERDIKLLVVACNTASAFALDELRDELDIPVIGVVQPGAQRAAAQTRNGRIGVIGTAGTISSGEYQRAIATYAPEAEVFCKACPLFVPLAEEGWTDGDVPALAAQAYLAELLDSSVDTVVLGCTHYPLLRGVIGRVAGKQVTLVDSAEATAAVVGETLGSMGIHEEEAGTGTRAFLVTDAPATFAKVGERFFGNAINAVEWVDIA